jgi:hypothetical protein
VTEKCQIKLSSWVYTFRHFLLGFNLFKTVHPAAINQKDYDILPFENEYGLGADSTKTDKETAWLRLLSPVETDYFVRVAGRPSLSRKKDSQPRLLQ